MCPSHKIINMQMYDLLTITDMQIQQQNVLVYLEKNVSAKDFEIWASRMMIYEEDKKINGKMKKGLGVISVG